MQPELRNNLIFFLIRGNEDKSKRERLGLLPFALKKMEETYSYDQTYAKYSLALAKGYDVVAMLAPTEEKQQYLAKAEVYYKKALALRSSSQEILYPYALNLINQKRAPEALTLLEASRLQEPRVREVHHYIGLAYYSLGPNYYDRSLEQFERALGDTEEFIEQLKKESLMTKKDQEKIRENHDVDKSVTEVVYNNLFSYYYQKKDIPHFLTVLNRLEYFNEKQADTYAQIEAYIVKNKSLPLITIQ